MATALREVLAEFQIKVDLTELKVADASINQFIVKIRELRGLIRSMPKFDSIGKIGMNTKGSGSSQKKAKDPSVGAQDFDSAANIQARAKALEGLEGKHRDLTARLFDQRLAQERLATTIKNFKEALAQSGTVSEASKKKLAGLEQQYYRISNSVQATTDKLKGFQPVAEKAQGFFAKLRSMFGSESSRRAQGEMIPGGAIKNLQEASREGDGLFAVLGRLRRMWGLLQFTVGGGFALAGIKGLINEMDEASKQATRLNMTIEEYQVVNKFAQLAGASTAALSNTIKQLAKNTINAADGAKAQAQAFKELDIEIKKNDGTFKDTTTLLFEVGGALGELEDGTKRLALAQKLLGKEATAILPAFKDGKEAALAQLAALRELAVAYDQEAANAAEAFNDTLDISVHQLRSVALQGISILLPYLVSLVKWSQESAKRFKDLMRGTSSLQTVLVALGGAISLHLISKLAAAFLNLSLLRKTLLRVAQIAMRFILPFLLLEDIITWLRGGDSLLGRMLNKFKPGAKDSKAWLDTVLKGFAQIKKAIGLLESAWRVFRARFWNDGTLIKPEDIANDAELAKLWEELKAGASKAVLELWAVFKEESVKALKRIWEELFRDKGEGVPDESAIVQIGGDIGSWLLKGLALVFAAKAAITAFLAFGSSFGAAMMSGLTAGVALPTVWTTIFALIAAPLATIRNMCAIAGTASGTAFSGGFLAGISSIGAGVAAAMAAISTPVMIAAVVVGAILLLIFSETARDIAYEMGEAIYEGLIKWGTRFWEVAKIIADGFVEAHIIAIKSIADEIPVLKDALIDAITNFNWGGFVDAALGALGRVAKAFRGLFGKMSDEIGDLKHEDPSQPKYTRLTQEQLDEFTQLGARIGPDQTPGVSRTSTVIDKRSVTQTFTGAQDPAEIRRATNGAVQWAESPNRFLDSDEAGY